MVFAGQVCGRHPRGVDRGRLPVLEVLVALRQQLEAITVGWSCMGCAIWFVLFCLATARSLLAHLGAAGLEVSLELIHYEILCVLVWFGGLLSTLDPIVIEGGGA